MEVWKLFFDFRFDSTKHYDKDTRYRNKQLIGMNVEKEEMHLVKDVAKGLYLVVVEAGKGC